MNQDKIKTIMASINESLVEKDATLEEVEALVHSIVRHFLDNLTDIADIDYFQDRLNDMVDKYVDTHFEDVLEDKAG
ncbi:MAG: hypothetical protein ACNS63_08265 [Candidatus Nitrospinota bacterium M3_3B_026]